MPTADEVRGTLCLMVHMEARLVVPYKVAARFREHGCDGQHHESWMSSSPAAALL